MTTAANDPQRTVSGVCLMLSPIITIIAEIIRYQASAAIYVWSGVLSLISVALSMHVILGLRHLLRRHSPYMAVYGCGLALFLVIFAVGIFNAYLVSWALLPDRTASEAAVRAAFAKLFSVFFVPGVLYLICRAVIGFGLWRAKVVPARIGLLMGIGYLLVPVGRIPNIPPLIYLSSLLLLVSEGWLGRKVLTQENYWQQGGVAS